MCGCEVVFEDEQPASNEGISRSDDALIREQPVTGIGDHAKGFAER
jgi:hypothetical protein